MGGGVEDRQVFGVTRYHMCVLRFLLWTQWLHPAAQVRDGQMLLVTSLLDLNSDTIPCLLPLESITGWKREAFHNCGGKKL